MNNLSWLTKWYANHVCKSMGNTIDINISTIQNSAWSIKINLIQSNYSKTILKKITKAKSDYNWYSIEIKDKVFLAEGDFTKLDFLIGKFREVIGENSNRLLLKDDFFFETDIQNFLFEDEKNTVLFIHYTHKESIAENILKTGLEFAYAFDKTATKVKNSTVDLNYHHYVRKQFGENVVIICISKRIYKKYLDKINQSGSSTLRVEEILTDKEIFLNEESEKVYTLHYKFIKGYFNYKTNRITKNPEFDPYFDSEIFLKNIKCVQSKKRNFLKTNPDRT